MRLHVHDWGNAAAPTVVCVHGVSGHGRRFRRLAEERLAARFHVVAPDLRGHGRSGWEPPWDLDTHLDDVLETFGDTVPSLWVGHSFGGRLVLELAARRPELVRCAVLLDPAIDILPHVGFDFAQDAATERRLRVRGRGDRGAPDERLPDPALGARGRGARAPRVDPRRQAPLALRASRGCDHVQRALPGAARLRRRWPASRRCWSTPSTSASCARSSCDEYPAALGDGLELVGVPGGHVVYWDAFDETADAVEKFLIRHSPVSHA